MRFKNWTAVSWRFCSFHSKWDYSFSVPAPAFLSGEAEGGPRHFRERDKSISDYGSNSTWLDSTRLDSTRHIRRVEPMHFGCVELVEEHSSTRSTRSSRLARLARLARQSRTCRVESSRVEPSGIWAYMVANNAVSQYRTYILHLSKWLFGPFHWCLFSSLPFVVPFLSLSLPFPSPFLTSFHTAI